MYETLFELPISNLQRERWKSGELFEEWFKMFPELFDHMDFENTVNMAAYGYKFVDWLSAITVYECLGYLSLVEGYEFNNHERKQKVIKSLLPKAVLEIIQLPRAERKAQCPDLLCYSPDYSDWFFCEVKGPGDNLSENQDALFGRLYKASNKKPIQLIKLFRHK